MTSTDAGPILVLCDFDGTITTEDVTNVLWDRYGLPNWRDELLPPYRAGRTTTLEVMDKGWRVIDLPEAQLISTAREGIRLRDGFEAFLEACMSRDWPLHVISSGLDWYVRAFLPPGVPFTCYAAALEGGWRVRLPDGYELPLGADFKVHTMRQLQRERPTLETVFIGDGRNDFPIARETDRVFAVRGSTLARLCREGDVACIEFQSFREVEIALSSGRTRGAKS